MKRDIEQRNIVVFLFITLKKYLYAGLKDFYSDLKSLAVFTVL